MKINIIGSLFSQTGYAAHTRGLANALYKHTQDIHLDVSRPAGWEVQCNDAELQMINNERYSDGTTIMISMPHQWPLGLVEQQEAFWGFCVWEGDKVPAFWEHIFNDDRVTGVLVPSQHVKDAILNTFKCKKEIVIIPHGVDDVFTDCMLPERKADAPFTFVGAGGWAQGINDRKGIQWLFKAFSAEFSKEEKVQLLIKINTVYNKPGWNLANEMIKLNLDNDRPPILINTEVLDRSKLPGIYHGDCFVYPTMGEGFGLTAAEALSMGLPIIYSDFGGQTDFCSEDFGWSIPTKLVEVNHDVTYEGVSWGMPDLDILRERMRYAFNNQKECREKGLKAAEWVKTSLTWNHSADKLIQTLFI